MTGVVQPSRSYLAAERVGLNLRAAPPGLPAFDHRCCDDRPRERGLLIARRDRFNERDDLLVVAQARAGKRLNNPDQLIDR